MATPTPWDQRLFAFTSGLHQFHYKPERDSATEVRNVLLVVAALITAATFAAGLNPPGGVWQETSPNTPPDNPAGYHIAGKAVLASQSVNSYRAFLVFNSAAFSASTLVIFYLVYNFPFYIDIWIAMIGMTVTYGVAISAVSPHGVIETRLVYVVLAGPYIVRFMLVSWQQRLMAVEAIKKACGKLYKRKNNSSQVES